MYDFCTLNARARETFFLHDTSPRTSKKQKGSNRGTSSTIIGKALESRLTITALSQRLVYSPW